jgi:hypothetical protein
MRKFIALIMAVSFMSSCKKEDDIKTKIGYFPLSIGNYWIYQEFMIDTSGNEIANSKLDSVIIKRDTIINDKKYFVFEGTNYPFTARGNWGIVDILRDSSGYIVNQNGTVLFTRDNFTDTIAYHAVTDMENGDTLVLMTYQMDKMNKIITVPAGSFDALNYRGTVTTSMNTPGIKYPRYLNIYYADGVGKILYTYFYVQSPTIYEKRLVRYYVNE